MADDDSLIPPHQTPDDDPINPEPEGPNTDAVYANASDGTNIAQSVVPINIEDEMRTSFLNYSMAVIISRALPDVRDGLKPVQRRILMAMHDLNLTPGAQHRKSAKIAGDTSGNYHPHGEAVVYPTMVRMAQPFSLRYMLVDGQGNFGSVDGDPPAAMRYTEARMSAFAVQLLNDLDKDTVDWTDNYDQTRQEPTVLPAGFPNFLCNGGEGIAVGMATKVPPHNLREVVDSLIHVVDKPDCTVDDLMLHVKGPDFPTGAMILGVKGVREAYATGRGTVTMQAKTQIDISDNGKSQIIVTELPYQVNKAKLIILISELSRDKKIDGITSCNDYSDRTGMRIVIELRRDTYPKKILNFLLKHTPMRLNFSVNMLALVNNQPRLLTLKAALVHYLDHRREVIRRRTLFDLNRAKYRAHILEGQQIALDVLDEIIALIRRSRTPEIARTEMMTRWILSQIQADAILAMQLRQLTSLERDKIESDYKDVLKLIAFFEDILTSAVRVNQILKQELRALRDKHGDERRTRIIPTEADEIGEEDMIPEEETIISITRDGYIKRVDKDTYPTQNRAGRGRKGASIKEEDMIEHLFIATTHHFILFFTDRGRVYRLKAYEVPATSRQAMGTAVVNLINILPGERITAVVPMREYKDTDGFLLFATELGEVKRTSVSDFKNLRASGLACFDIEETDALRWVAHTTGTDEVVLVTRKGMSIRFAETDVPVRGRTAGGVRGIRLSAAKGDSVVGMGLVDTVQDLLVISELGIGKRTKLKEYRAQTRGGIGLRTVSLNSKTGVLVDAKVVTSEDKLLIMTRGGVTIRINVADIRAIGRSTSGVKMINLDPGDSVATVERVTAQRDPELDGEPPTQAA
jgi:DNA gyrase subunit A